MAITAAIVKELRDKTGAGMMDCKKALVEVNGDMEKAVDWLRQKGISKAASKTGRATSEGLVTYEVSEDGANHAMASLMCETDFVARGDKFKDMAAKVAKAVLDHNPVDAESLDGIIGDEVKQLIGSLGENMRLGKFARHTKQEPEEVVGAYVHANGKIGTMVFLKVDKADAVNNPDIKALAKNLAMQVAANSPLAIDAAGLDPKIVEREKEVYRQKAIEEGKSANIVEKIAEGAIKKFQQEVCLLDQPLLRDDKKSVAQIIKETEKSTGVKINVTGFERIQLASE